MERKLASIQKVAELSPITGADKIEKCKILGWDCVVKKGEFQVGDMCVYIEIDSLIPKTIWSGFLFKEGTTVERYRLKTCKLRGQISQGLVLPIQVLYNAEHSKIDVLGEGDDVSELLGIIKYEPDISPSLQGLMKGSFPCWIPKTDETRIQSEPWLLERKKDASIYITEKLDGSSMTCYLNEDVFGVCSRNMDMTETANSAYWYAARRQQIEQSMRGEERQGWAIQGELIGPGIQKNKYELKEPEFRAFNIYNIREGRYLDLMEFLNTCERIGIPTVPLLGLESVRGNVDFWVEKSKGKSELNPNADREGLVVRGVTEEAIEKYGRFSFKVINPEFLLKNGE